MVNIVINNTLQKLMDGIIIIVKNSESSLGRLDLGIPIDIEREWFVSSLIHSTLEKMIDGSNKRELDILVHSYLKDLSIDCTEEELVNTMEDFPPVYTLDRNLQLLRGVMIRYIFENIVWADEETVTEVAATSDNVIPFRGRSRK